MIQVFLKEKNIFLFCAFKIKKFNESCVHDCVKL